MLAPGGVAYVSTPNLLTLAPPGAEKSDNPWHVHEYRAEEFRRLCEGHFPRVEVLGLFHARKLRAHELAIRLGWDSVHQRLGLTKPFYDRFTPAIAASDFALRKGNLDRGPRLRRRLPCLRAEVAGDLAIVLHSHMPYVEGFGTYPFGEEWLFDAVIRSYLPVLEVARDLTVTVTPVLADQLEEAGTARRLRDFLVEWRIGAAEADLDEVPAECRAACEASWRATDAPWSCSTMPAGTRWSRSGGPAGEGRVALGASSATHAVLPLLATREGLRLQLDAGHPLAPPPLRLGRRLLAAGVRLRAGPRVAARRAGREVVLHRPERPRGAARGAGAGRTEAGPVALPIDWEAISWLWALDGYPSDPAHAQFAGKSLRGIRIWRVGGGAYDPARRGRAGAEQAREFLAAVAARLRAYATAARAARPARLRDRHRAARALVVGGTDLAARRCSRAPPRPGCAC